MEWFPYSNNFNSNENYSTPRHSLKRKQWTPHVITKRVNLAKAAAQFQRKPAKQVGLVDLPLLSEWLLAGLIESGANLLHGVKCDPWSLPPSQTKQSRRRSLCISQYWVRHGARSFYSQLLTDFPIWECHPFICCLIDGCSGSNSNVWILYAYVSSLCGCQFTVLAHYLWHFFSVFVCNGVYIIFVYYVYPSCQASFTIQSNMP